MDRNVEPELLDELPADDARAVRSRKDLRRVNAWMGNHRVMARALRVAFPQQPPGRMIEIGAGDGNFLLGVARRLSPAWKGVSAELLDRQDLVTPQTHNGFEGLGWRAETLKADVLAWLSQSAPQGYDAMLANLFLHHFSDAQLTQLLREAARRAQVFVAVEPRRSAWALAVSRLLWLIGCNEVTRHDATISVRAGFAGRELSRLWPCDGAWSLHEQPAGLFSHVFIAHRRSVSSAQACSASHGG